MIAKVRLIRKKTKNKIHREMKFENQTDVNSASLVTAKGTGDKDRACFV